MDKPFVLLALLGRFQSHSKAIVKTAVFGKYWWLSMLL